MIKIHIQNISSLSKSLKLIFHFGDTLISKAKYRNIDIS